jgi:hypothetical protein
VRTALVVSGNFRIEKTNNIRIMKKLTIIQLLLVIISLFSCKEEKDDVLISYSTVIDSTFNCSVSINGDRVKFPYQQYTGIIKSSISQKVQLLKNDTVTYSYTLTYYTGLSYLGSNKIYIEFSKKFRVKDLSNAVMLKDSTYILGQLTDEEFQKIFDSSNMKYSYFGPNYQRVLDGVSIMCTLHEDFDLWYSTAINSDTVKYYNGNSTFKLLKVTKLAPSKLIVKGQFELLIFNWINKSQGTMTEGYFKGYIEK